MLRSLALAVILAGMVAGCSMNGGSDNLQGASGGAGTSSRQDTVGIRVVLGLSCTGGRVHLSARLFVRGGRVTDSYTVRPAVTCVVQTARGVPIRVRLTDEHGPVKFPTVNTRLALLAEPMWWTRGDPVGKRLDVTDTMSSGATLKRSAWCKLGGHTYTLKISAPGARKATATRRIC